MSGRINPTDRTVFALVFHEAGENLGRSSHYDLFVRDNDYLLTWEFQHHPMDIPTQSVLQLANHRLEYLDFSGPLSGDRGILHPIDSGECSWLHRQPDRLILSFQGMQVCGTLYLTRVDCQKPCWNSQFIKEC